MTYPEFTKDFQKLELQHSQDLKGLKMGIIYATPGQIEPKDMFGNSILSQMILIT